VNHIIVEAMAVGDLPGESYSAEQATFALVSVTVGSHLRVQAGITNAMMPVRVNQDMVCDGLKWRPYLNEFDHVETDQRIVNELFPNAVNGGESTGACGGAELKIELEFVRFEPLVVPKKSLTGDATERVDTRVLQVIYRVVGGMPERLFIGQQMDVFVEATESQVAGRP
jgi:hypothetical protein